VNDLRFIESLFAVLHIKALNMLDPLTALSVAASIVQFVDFAAELLTKGKEIHRSGGLSDNNEIEAASSRLHTLSSKLGESLRLNPGPLSEQDQSLEYISQGCVKISVELDALLQNLKVPAWQRHRRWGSLRQAFKSLWSKKEVQKCEEELAKLRDELEIHVLFDLRSVRRTITRSVVQYIMSNSVIETRSALLSLNRTSDSNLWTMKSKSSSQI